MPKTKGFTLIELVMVIVLLGILAVYAAPRLGNIFSMKGASFTDKLRADIRYAQNLAMTSGLRSRVTLTAGSYAVTSSATSTCSSFNPARDPATGGSFSVSLTGSYAGITLTLPAMTCLEYDSLGRPYDCTGLGGVCSAVLSGMSITVNSSGVAGSVLVSSQTGAVNK